MSYRQQQQPDYPVNPVGMERPWTSGLCSWTEEMDMCCLATCCPCIALTDIVRERDGLAYFEWGLCLSQTALMSIYAWCLLPCGERTRTRHMLGLKGSQCSDCLVHTFCCPCALTQEWREIRAAREAQYPMQGPPHQVMGNPQQYNQQRQQPYNQSTEMVAYPQVSKQI